MENEIRYIENDEPINTQKNSRRLILMLPLLIFLFTAVPIIFLSIAFPNAFNMEIFIVVAIALIIMISFWIIFLIHFYTWHKKIWPQRIGFDEKDIILDYEILGKKSISLEEIIETKLITDGNDSSQVILYVGGDAKKKLGAIIRRDADMLIPVRWFIGNIYGDAAIEINKKFEEYKKRFKRQER